MILKYKKSAKIFKYKSAELKKTDKLQDLQH